MKRCVVVLLILAISLVISGTAFGELQEEICFSASDGSQMVKEIEDCRSQIQYIELLKQENIELQKKAETLEAISKHQEAQLAVANETIEKLKEIQETQKEAYEKQIKETKPSLWQNLKTGVGGAVIGGLCVALLILL